MAVLFWLAHCAIISRYLAHTPSAQFTLHITKLLADSRLADSCRCCVLMFSNGLGDFVPVQGHCRHLTQIYADSHWMHPIILIVAPPASLKGVQRTSVMHLDSTGITGSWNTHLLIVIFALQNAMAFWTLLTLEILKKGHYSGLAASLSFVSKSGQGLN